MCDCVWVGPYAILVSTDGPYATSSQVLDVPHLYGAIVTAAVQEAPRSSQGPNGALVTPAETRGHS